MVGGRNDGGLRLRPVRTAGKEDGGREHNLTNSSGGTAWEAYPHAYGKAEVVSSLGSDAFNIRFPGQYYDAETGLHYNP